MTAMPPVPYAVLMAQIGFIAKSGAKLRKKKHIYKKKFAYLKKKAVILQPLIKKVPFETIRGTQIGHY